MARKCRRMRAKQDPRESVEEMFARKFVQSGDFRG